MCAREIHPWASVTIGPTGAMPADFWTKIGASASTLVNVLVCASQPSCLGQMIYKGLVALGTFLVDLARAIVDWGMRQLGALWNTIVAVAQKAAQGLGQLLDSFFALFTAPVKAVLAYLDGWKADIVRAARNLDQIARTFDGSPASAVRLGAAIGELLAAVFRPDIILLLTVMSFAMIAAVTATIATGIGYLIVSQVVPMITHSSFPWWCKPSRRPRPLHCRGSRSWSRRENGNSWALRLQPSTWRSPFWLNLEAR